MRLMRQKAERLIQGPSSADLMKHIELCARTCYKSEDKITEGSAEKLVGALIRSKHYAMLEHGTIYLTVPKDSNVAKCYKQNQFSRVIIVGDKAYITTNYRVIIENGWQDDLDYVDLPTVHERRFTFRLTTDRQIANEFERHRVFSFAQESTRYCDYSKDKFSGELTFIIPVNFDDELVTTIAEGAPIPESELAIQCEYWMDKCQEMEIAYNNAKSQFNFETEDAAKFLPLCLKTEVIMTGYESDWMGNFRNLRSLGTTGKPHKMAKDLADKILPLIK